jgi:hypothetical protein
LFLREDTKVSNDAVLSALDHDSSLNDSTLGAAGVQMQEWL